VRVAGFSQGEIKPGAISLKKKKDFEFLNGPDAEHPCKKEVDRKPTRKCDERSRKKGPPIPDRGQRDELKTSQKGEVGGGGIWRN